jgi:pimeloyl-ACP methyl ester carboxylesterase
VTTIRANGISLNIEQLDPAEPILTSGEAGEPAPVGTVVLIHGLALGNLATWYLTLANSFATGGFRVLMYDLRGHGYSERPPTGYRMADHVSDLEALLAALDITSPVYLCGVSYGGTIAFSYALHRPGDVAGIAAIESAPMTARWMSHMTARWMSHMTATLGNSQRKVSAIVTEGVGMAPRLRAQQAAEQIAAETTLRQDALAGPVLPDESLAALRLPVLCIYGGESRLAEFAPYVEQVIPGARSVIIPGHRHSVLGDATGTVGSLLMSWLGQVCGVAVRSGAVPSGPERSGPERSGEASNAASAG